MLKNQKQTIAITLSPDVVEKLREKKDRIGIPVSRQIEDALKKPEDDSHD